MAVPTKNFTWQQGEDGIISIIYKVSIDGAPAVAVDLSTDYAVRMDVRDDTSALLFTFNSHDIPSGGVDQVGSSDNEGTLGSDGEIRIVIPRSTTLTGGAFINKIGQTLNYDIFLRDTINNLQKKLVKGTITIEGSYTQWA